MGATEVGLLGIALAALVLTVWLPARPLRVVAAGWSALGLMVLLRAATGSLPASLFGGVLLGAAAGRWLPERVLRRVAFALPSLILLVFVTTLLMYLAPGSPFAQERAAPPQVEETLRAQYGVPESPTAFFAIYLRRLVLEGSLGPSIKVQGRAVEDLLLPALPMSLSLGVLALLLAVVLGIALGCARGCARAPPRTCRAWGSRSSASRCRTS